VAGALFTSVIGILRMRAWGIAAALGAALIADSVAIASLFPPLRLAVFYDGGGWGSSDAVRSVFAIAGVASLLIPAPVLFSWLAPAGRAVGHRFGGATNDAR
jgi:hypothetical protein